MKIVLGKGRKRSAMKGAELKVVVGLAGGSAPKFKGLTYSVAEGLRLLRRCYTELPEFALQGATSAPEKIQ